jgi:hypothetical protein
MKARSNHQDGAVSVMRKMPSRLLLPAAALIAATVAAAAQDYPTRPSM